MFATLRVKSLAAHAVHVLTASGVVFMLLAVAELMTPQPDVRVVFAWLIAATLVDAIDGPLARWTQVKTYAPDIDGRTIDDLVDYLGFTFVPLLMVWRMAWVPGDEMVRGVIVAIPMIASLLGFANTAAKDESGGFFRGFPSYWNIIAFYAGLLAAGGLVDAATGRRLNAAILIVLAVFTVAPIWLIYPNLSPGRWRLPILGGAYLWLILLLAMFPWYPGDVPAWLVLVSLVYPVFYVVVSLVLGHSHRKHARANLR